MNKIKVINADGTTSFKTPQDLDEEFRVRFKKLTDQELIEAFNRQVGNPGWVSARASYLSALHGELKSRGFDISAIAGEDWFSLRSRIRLIGNVVETLDKPI